jgi:hypothetical protein
MVVQHQGALAPRRTPPCPRGRARDCAAASVIRLRMRMRMCMRMRFDETVAGVTRAELYSGDTVAGIG